MIGSDIFCTDVNQSLFSLFPSLLNGKSGTKTAENSQRAMPHPATRHPQHQPTAVKASRAFAVPHLRRLIHQLVKGRVDVVRKLYFRDRPHPARRAPDRKAGDALLRQRRVEHALAAKVRRQTHRAPEDAAKGNVLAEDEHPLVRGEGVPQGGVDRLEEILPLRAAGLSCVRRYFGIGETCSGGVREDGRGGVVDWLVQAGGGGLGGVSASVSRGGGVCGFWVLLVGASAVECELSWAVSACALEYSSCCRMSHGITCSLWYEV